MRIVFCLSLLLAFSSLNAQQNCPPIQCQGSIPDFLISDVKENIDKAEEIHINDDLDDDIAAGRKDLIRKSALNYEHFYNNGLLLFGNKTSNYLNSIKDLLLQDDPQLQKEVEVFTLRSSEINAFCDFEGHIYITIGLLSRLKNEAQLAFIISHEITHYTEDHLIESVNDSKELKDLVKKRKSLTFDDQFKLKFKRQKAHEIEADDIGLKRFLKTNYSETEALSALTILSETHLAISSVPFDITFFNDVNFTVPSCFFKEDVLEEGTRKELDDTFHTHPNISIRKDRIQEYLTANPSSGTSMSIVSDQLFSETRGESRLEQVRLLLLSRRYGEALYSSYALLEEYPNQREYLEISFAKALYGLAKYKSQNEFHYVALGYNDRQGESQNLHYFLRQLTSKQLNAITVKYLYAFSNRYETETSYIEEMIRDIAEQMVVKNRLTLSKFWSESSAIKNNDKFAQKEADSQDQTNVALRKVHKLFYLGALVEEKESSLIVDAFEKGVEAKKELDEEKFMSYKEKEKREKEEQRNYLKIGYEIYADSVIILEPSFHAIFSKEKDFKKNSKTEEAVFSRLKEEIAIYKNKRINLLTSSDLESQMVEEYNDFALAKAIQSHRRANFVKTVPLNSDDLHYRKNTSNYSHLLYIDILNGDESELQYYFYLLSLKTGEIEYLSKESIRTGSEHLIASRIRKDLKAIFN